MNIISASKEDYLKALLKLSKYNAKIHCSDVAKSLCVSRASVSRMMNELRDQGYIIKEKYTTVILTQKGIDAAELVQKKHHVLKAFFINVLGVDEKIANDDACKIEHVISTKTVDKISQIVNSLNV